MDGLDLPAGPDKSTMYCATREHFSSSRDLARPGRMPAFAVSHLSQRTVLYCPYRDRKKYLGGECQVRASRVQKSLARTSGPRVTRNVDLAAADSPLLLLKETRRNVRAEVRQGPLWRVDPKGIPRPRAGLESQRPHDDLRTPDLRPTPSTRPSPCVSQIWA